jgi:hypothetical protein
MPGTGLQFNWENVKIGDTVIDRVKGFNIRYGLQYTDWAADNDHFISCTVQNFATPTGSISTGNTGVALTCLGLEDQTVIATHLDAKGVTGGDINYTCVGTTVVDVNPNGQFGQYSDCTIELKFISVDGATSPISFSRS